MQFPGHNYLIDSHFPNRNPRDHSRRFQPAPDSQLAHPPRLQRQHTRGEYRRRMSTRPTVRGSHSLVKSSVRMDRPAQLRPSSARAARSAVREPTVDGHGRGPRQPLWRAAPSRVAARHPLRRGSTDPGWRTLSQTPSTRIVSRGPTRGEPTGSVPSNSKRGQASPNPYQPKPNPPMLAACCCQNAGVMACIISLWVGEPYAMAPPVRPPRGDAQLFTLKSWRIFTASSRA